MRRLLAILVAAIALGAQPAHALDDGLAKRPPMGWNSWYHFRCQPTEQAVRANADAIVDSGLAKLGYRYINLDDCWMALERDSRGRLTANPERFPSGMPALGEYLHGKGLRYGIYTSAGPTTCGHPYPASYGNYELDFRTFAEWKVDYVKVDWCSSPPHNKIVRAYRELREAALKAPRKMIQTVSSPGFHKVWRWGHRYGHTWRIAADANGSWESILKQIDRNAPLWKYAGPGGWNDPDMLQVGSGQLTIEQERSHFSMWAMMASPLLIGYDVPTMRPESRAILANENVIAVDQDRLGKQGRRLDRDDGVETWLKPLAGGDFALALFNRTGEERSAAVVPSRWGDAKSLRLTDLWSGERQRVARGKRVTATLPAYGTVVWRAEP